MRERPAPGELYFRAHYLVHIDVKFALDGQGVKGFASTSLSTRSKAALLKRI